MAARDEVAAMPGTVAKKLATDADKVYKAKPGEIETLAGKFDTASTGVEEWRSEVNKAVTNLDGRWEGSSADAFVTYMGQIDKGGSSLKEAYTNAAKDLRAAGKGISDAKGAMEGHFEKLLREYREATKGLKGEDDKLIAKADSLATGYQSLINEQITNANTALNTAKDALAKRPGEIKPSLLDVKSPGEQPFTPGPGKPVQWTATPEPPPGQNGQTDPSSNQPPPGSNNSSNSGSPNSSSGGSNSDSGSSGGSGGSGGGGGLGPSGGPPAGPPPGNVDQWIREAIKILQENGIPVTEENIQQIWTIIQHESGGDPNAINDWDSNAAKGTPSKGLMQCIDPTFDAHSVPGHKDIWNPVDNIVAGVKYTFDRYGSLDEHPGLASISGGGGYKPY
ncbi:WXG100 family type VII secretion target [Herbihabitans rhizosphaerae]|uniref:WXG100 family type VII secretion target n=1 Tax=Herbihabitans rhizosphaerae TaxID=1872711 RepID=A0A4Q7KXM4_9PSEU|nr:WXG100 family type VII secretion target [Herbihabitans rhizosphaerae]RZS41406.1 WXG100 family type VII secretion target [Herbihabitans rhizosphaerae]